MKESIIKSLESIASESTFFNIIKNIYKSKQKRNYVNIVISLILTIPFVPIIFKVGYSEDTVDRVFRIVQLSKELSVALFGIIFTGYAIFQAFASGKIIKKLLGVKGQKFSVFQEYNHFFFSLSLKYLIMIIIDFVLIVALDNISKDFTIEWLSIKANNITATIAIGIYFWSNIYILFEIKSFLYNIYQVFNMNAFNEGIEMASKPEEDDKNLPDSQEEGLKKDYVEGFELDKEKSSLLKK